MCGGVGGRKGPCFAWLDNGWEQTKFEFMRLCFFRPIHLLNLICREFAASSMLSDGGWLVTGGWIPGRQTDTATLHCMQGGIGGRSILLSLSTSAITARSLWAPKYTQLVGIQIMVGVALPWILSMSLM